MHEIRVNVPSGKSKEIAEIARRSGIDEVTVFSVYVHGPEEQKDVISVETSTPQAKAFVDSLFMCESFDPGSWSITSRELRAIFSRQPARELTRPMTEPALDVFEDLWQMSHITASYVARAFGAAVLLGYGMMEDKVISIVVAALFLPFLSEVLALSFGLWSGDKSLAKQGATAISVSLACSIAGGALVAALHGPPMAFTDFQKPLLAFGISSVIGVVAGLSSADDVGRRYLIGVAAAVQYAVFPVWFGISLVLGFPSHGVTLERLSTLAVNFVTIGVASAAVYGMIGMRRSEVRRFVQSKVWGSR